MKAYIISKKTGKKVPITKVKRKPRDTRRIA